MYPRTDIFIHGALTERHGKQIGSTHLYKIHHANPMHIQS